MYWEPGWYVTDFCLVPREGLVHLFHIRGERWTWPLGYREITLGHATSPDLEHWTAHPYVVPAGPPGSWDESGVWAPDVIERDGTYYMFYTGADRLDNQHIGLATSRDLFTWQKHPRNPVVSPAEWSDRAAGTGVACRDAMVFPDAASGRYLLFYTATMADGRACLGLAESSDLLVWQDHGPTFIEEDRSYNRCESPYLVAHDGLYYLFYSAKGGPKSKGHRPQDFAHFDIVYLIAESPTGPWRKPPNHLLLEGWVCASEHPTIAGTTYALFVVQEALEGIWGASALSPAHRLEWQPDGTVAIVEHPLPSLARRRLAPQGTTGTEWSTTGGEWQAEEAAVAAACPAPTGGFFMAPAWASDMAVEATVHGAADARGGLVVRGNLAGMAGYTATLDCERGRLVLSRLYPGAPETQLGERQVDARPGEGHHIKLRAAGVLLEVYLDGVLMIVRTDSLYREGCWGLCARGTVRFDEVAAHAEE